MRKSVGFKKLCTQQSIALNGAAPTVTNYTYNAGNQLTSDGTTSYTYDNNGNLTTYTWDRANRMISGGGSTYAYDGAGNRIRQTVGANVTRYLLDLQPGLAVVLAATTGSVTDLDSRDPFPPSFAILLSNIAQNTRRVWRLRVFGQGCQPASQSPAIRRDVPMRSMDTRRGAVGSHIGG